jgi:predicted transcriptional regulator
VVGLITDRDICIGGATKNGNLSNIAVEEIMTGKVYSCAPEDDVRKALKTMQERKVRRLPVVAPDGTLEGLLSINDITLSAKETTGRRVPDVSFRDVVQTYKASLIGRVFHSLRSACQAKTRAKTNGIEKM